MYNEFFHFSELPFSIAPDPHFMYMSTRHQEGLAHLLYGINHGGGFVALTGEVGTGKTTLCHCLLEQLPDNIDIALILNPKLNAIELLATICDDLSIPYDMGGQSLKNLVDALNRYLLSAHANNRRTVLIIDEAQNLNLEVLEQIRLLTNLETSKTKLLQIILVGQPELNEVLNRRELRQLNQRITARYHLLPLSLEETRIYIRHRLTVCKGDPGLFQEKAIKKIYEFSGGIPRVINIICHCALLGAYSTDSRFITPAIVKRAAEETLGRKVKPSKQLRPLLGLLVFCLLMASLYFRQYLTLAQSSIESNTLLSLKKPNSESSKPAVSRQILPATAKKIEAFDVKSFSLQLIDNQNSLNAAIKKALKIWGKENITEEQPDCKTVQKNGLLCSFDKGNWKDLVAFNRPAIMEFTMPGEKKRFALLTGIHNGQPVFRFEEDREYPLPDVLSLWDGYYLLFWQPPLTGVNLIFPGQTSTHVEWLRKQLTEIDGINQQPVNPQFFDAELKARVISFQKTKHLKPDGKVGMQTVFYLDSATVAKNSPHLKD